MKKTALLLLLALAACDSADELAGPGQTPNLALIDAGVAYPEIDLQLRRLYAFNNCLSGLAPYNSSPNCQAADLTYDVATLANWELSSVFDDGVTTTRSQALVLLNTYIAKIDAAFAQGRVSCRAAYATVKFATALRAIVTALPGTVDLSSMPQPLTTPLQDLAPFAGVNSYKGVVCGTVAPNAPIASAGGYSIFALNTSCSDGGRSLHVLGDEVFVSHDSRSNASLKIEGDNGFYDGQTSYRCTSSVTGSGNVFTSGPNQNASVVAPPFSYTSADFPCTYSNAGSFNVNNPGPWWVGGTSASKQLKPGVYCADRGTLTLDVPGVTGTVTFKAASYIWLKGDASTLKPFKNSVLAYSLSSATNKFAIQINGKGNSLAGHLYAPAGQVVVEGLDLFLNGTILGRTVELGVDRTTIFGISGPPVVEF